MAVDHLEVALVDRQVDRLAQRPAAVVERPARVGQLHEVAEVLDRRVAPAVVEVVDERRAVGRDEDHVRIADLDAAGVVARALGEDPRRGRLDDRAAHPAREADALAGDVGAGAAEDLGRLGEVDDLDADLLEEGVGVGLDLLEALGRDDLDRRERAGQVGHRVHVACQALGLARGPAASDGWDVRGPGSAIGSPRVSSARSRADHHGTAAASMSASEAARELATLVEGQAGAAWRDGVADEVEARSRAPQSSRPGRSRRPGVSAMTRVSASMRRLGPVAFVRRIAAPRPMPSTRAPVTDRPPAVAKRVRSGPSAALWNRPPATTGGRRSRSSRRGRSPRDGRPSRGRASR